MKNTIKIAGIISLILVIGFTFFSCDSGGVFGGGLPPPGPPVAGFYDKEGTITGNDTPIDLSTTGTAGDSIVQKAVKYVNANTGKYTLLLDEDVTTGSTALTKSGTALTIIGLNAERVISLKAAGHLFEVDSGVTLTLGSKIVLSGAAVTPNNGPLVSVINGGKLIMKAGSVITGNDVGTSNDGGGVILQSSGTSSSFVMEGGIIHANKAQNGGGVYIRAGGNFTMLGGTIMDNTITTKGSGVYVSLNGIFNMVNGTITRNTAGTGDGGGGAVYVYPGATYNKTGGTISDNTNGDKKPD